MQKTLLDLTERIESLNLKRSSVIPWSSPIPVFGSLNFAKIATLGINPSNREFVDAKGNELAGALRRFHTLDSFGLKRWKDVKTSHLNEILRSCEKYFDRNPYDGWFKSLDAIINRTSASYYSKTAHACHLDLIPYATSLKWTNLSSDQKKHLFESVGDSLGLLIRNSGVGVLVLNGKTVAKTLAQVSDVIYETKEQPSWTLSRKNGENVVGYSYQGYMRQVGNTRLKKDVLVVGFNHNIQSSFGVTNDARTAIGTWIANTTKRGLL